MSRQRIIGWSLVVLALAGFFVALEGMARAQSVSTIRFRVWQSTSTPQLVYLSVRPEGEGWQQPEHINFNRQNRRGTWRYGDHSIEVLLPETGTKVVPTDGTPPSEFRAFVRPSRDRQYLDASVNIPIVIRYPGGLYLTLQLDDGSSTNCQEAHTLFPEDGLQDLSCSWVVAEPKDVKRMWAIMYLGDDDHRDQYEYRCVHREEPTMPVNHWTCKLLVFR